ncbi:ATP-binding cassette domain-containing protein [Amycolatopsis magusensis]|uniref:ABC-2 type transport system ATP-binding protein n=1 Tax=Amycolatopsis magusensis TaxID=882444 RepID=A0ABS4PR61_9PSEU|nr:ATP-binding cassette domain-containing protein [Amycolatopsis magusensis]MBP2181896.1 ABC-2 type transport system ATP-binding protein [Amycolatopsis magusensis]MDI5975493.1 ATP-binding cassette domain-containing protein [Amycolatopsis magusensis]
MIEVQGLVKSFAGHRVLTGVDLRVEPGRMLALLGPNGAGKTTVVRILSTLLRADAGRATVQGLDVARQAAQVRRSIGLTGQFSAVDKLLTGRENLIMMGRLQHLGRGAKARAGELLEQFSLTEAADRPAKTYSGGMFRRLDLAASLITSPPVLFLDEPTTGLDPRSRTTMWEAIRQLLTGGTTILLTTQYLDEADQLADRIAVLDDGQVIAEGSADELKAKVGDERAELTFDDPADTARACAVLAVPQTELLSVRISGVRELRLLLERLDGAGLEPASLRVKKPTLDDVFLSVTGRRGGEKASAA